MEKKTKIYSCSFAFGKCVKVLHCFHGHEFEIGEIVYIVGKSDYDDAWLCRNAKGVEWFLQDEEGEVVNCKCDYILTAEQGHRIIKCSKCGNVKPI